MIKKERKIMAIIDDIIDSVGKAGKFVADKAVDAKDYVSLEYKLSKINSELDKCYIELGKLIYALNKEGKTDEGQSAQYVGKIDALKSQQQDLLNEMSKFKRTCASCGKRAGGNATFCKNCGNKL